jgi:transcriptional regulator with XRE-family HTH domain
MSAEGATGLPADPVLGPRIRSLRRRGQLSLRTVSERTGLSESFLSQLERGLTNPSVASVRRIADALGVGVAVLFDEASRDRPAVIRHADRRAIMFGDGASKSLLTPPGMATDLEVLAASFAPGGSTGQAAYTHGSSDELVLVVKGRACVEVDDEAHHLSRGDAIAYDSQQKHRLVNDGATQCEVIWVISPRPP